MRRRVIGLLVGVVTLNLVLMAAMFVHMRSADKCDTSARGLVIWDDDRDRWLQVSVPLEPTDLPRCKGRLETELKVLPG